KDESTLDLDKIPAVSVDTAGMSAISIFQFETLVIDPKVQANGLSESDLEYEWLINTETDNRDFVTISQSKKLEYEVALKPTAAGTQHILTLKITDKRNQLEYYTTWPMTVRNSIGDGLVIVETYDGSTTDISHLMSPLV